MTRSSSAGPTGVPTTMRREPTPPCANSRVGTSSRGPTLRAGEAGDNNYVLASTYLLRSENAEGEPTFCLHVGANDGTSSTACALLSAVRQAGIDVPISAGGNTWNIQIAPDGLNRQDILELVD